MTIITLCNGVQVAGRLAGSTTGIAMTAVTVTCCACIMDPAATGKGCGAMAEMAIQRGCRVIGRFITGVAGTAIVNDAGMIKCSRYECGGVMANTAILVGDHVTV